MNRPYVHTLMPTAVLCLLLWLFACPRAHAQRVLRNLESNVDYNGTFAGDTIDSEKQTKKNVPTDVVAWVIDPIYGTRRPVDVDTLQHDFQGHSLSEGLNGEFNSLGNLGSPRESRIFMHRRPVHDFMPITNMDVAIEAPADYKYYNTKSPYMNLSYDWCGTKTTGFDNFKAIYTNNAGKRFNFGGIFQYLYGQGYYDNQHTAFLNGTGWGSYVSDHYDLHIHYAHHDMKMEENGGITDEAYITNPESMSRSYGADDIPTNLNNTWSRQNHDILTLNHRYHVGFMRTEEVDSATTRDYFVPVTSVFHSLELGKYRRRILSYDDPLRFYNYSYLPNDTTSDRYNLLQISNRVGITLHEGFNKYAVAGMSAYVGFIHRDYEMTDTVAGAASRIRTTSHVKENDVVVGGRIVRSQGSYVHYNVDAEIVAGGTNAGNISLNGHGDLNVPVLGDTARLDVDVNLSNKKPHPFYESFHSQNLWWDNSLDKESRMGLTATLSYPKTKTALTFGIENVSNYTYLKNTGQRSSTTVMTDSVAHNVSVFQEGSVQVLMARLRQQIKLGPAHLDADVTWQTSTNDDVLPLPVLSVYANLYFKFVLAKVLKVELGADMRYFTKYYAPDYDPATAQFIVQNDLTKEEVGDYPVFSAYANLALKKIRFYVKYYHLNQSDGRYFTMPRYPMNPGGLRFGVSWNFYD